jgi:hypothetical protein
MCPNQLSLCALIQRTIFTPPVKVSNIQIELKLIKLSLSCVNVPVVPLGVVDVVRFWMSNGVVRHQDVQCLFILFHDVCSGMTGEHDTRNNNQMEGSSQH